MVKLNINRDKSIMGAAMPYRIMINGTELGKLNFGKSLSFELENVQSTLKVTMMGNSIVYHKVEKEVVLFPQYCKTGNINCRISTQCNWVGYLTLGLLQAVAKIELDIEYC